MARNTRPAVPASGARLAIRLALGAMLVALAAGAFASAHAQQERELPAAVQEWLDRDQFRQWANLVRTGQELYAEGSCARCHGENGTAGRNGPDLTDAEWVQSDGSLEGIRETIFWGVRRRDFHDTTRRFEMNPQGGMELEWDQVRALAAYVWTLSNESGLPQR